MQLILPSLLFSEQVLQMTMRWKTHLPFLQLFISFQVFFYSEHLAGLHVFLVSKVHILNTTWHLFISHLLHLEPSQRNGDLNFRCCLQNFGHFYLIPSHSFFLAKESLSSLPHWTPEDFSLFKNLDFFKPFSVFSGLPIYVCTPWKIKR